MLHLQPAAVSSLKPLAIQGKQTLHNDIEFANLQNILSQINDVIQLDVMLHLQVH